MESWRLLIQNKFQISRKALDLRHLHPKYEWDKLLSGIIFATLSFRRLHSQLKAYIKAHPYLFAIQVFGLSVVLAAFIVLPILLAAVGFSAAGPVAGTAAAAWQASLGNVAAGSLFAFCQSASMGGAAAAGVISTIGGVGGAVAVVPGAVCAAWDKLNEAGYNFQKKLPKLKFW